jgi:hypothetical protein
MKTNELTGRTLDWAVCLIENPQACEYGVADWIEQRRRTVKNGEYLYRWHQSWMQAGPIIEQEEIGIKRRAPCMKGEKWEAMGSITAKGAGYRHAVGPTPLVAAMRCYVASKLGDDVEIPEELL